MPTSSSAGTDRTPSSRRNPGGDARLRSPLPLSNRRRQRPRRCLQRRLDASRPRRVPVPVITNQRTPAPSTTTPRNARMPLPSARPISSITNPTTTKGISRFTASPLPTSRGGDTSDAIPGVVVGFAPSTRRSCHPCRRLPSEREVTSWAIGDHRRADPAARRDVFREPVDSNMRAISPAAPPAAGERGALRPARGVTTRHLADPAIRASSPQTSRHGTGRAGALDHGWRTDGPRPICGECARSGAAALRAPTLDRPDRGARSTRARASWAQTVPTTPPTSLAQGLQVRAGEA